MNKETNKTLKSLLVYLYLENYLSTREIAGQWGVHNTWICILLKKYGIPRRNKSEAHEARYGHHLYRDKNWLRLQYCHNEESMADMSRMVGCNRTLIPKWINRYGIRRKERLITRIRRFLNI